MSKNKIDGFLLGYPIVETETETKIKPPVFGSFDTYDYSNASYQGGVMTQREFDLVIEETKAGDIFIITCDRSPVDILSIAGVASFSSTSQDEMHMLIIDKRWNIENVLKEISSPFKVWRVKYIGYSGKPETSELMQEIERLAEVVERLLAR